MTNNKKYSRIKGIGSYLPESIITNEDLAKLVETDDEWIKARTGISQRHINTNGMVTSDMCVKAAERALENSGVDREDIELILVATTTPDMRFPSTACFVQTKMGITQTAAFDLLATCSGFIYGLSVSDHFIRGGMYKTILLIGVEMISSITDWEDRDTCVLFGDGAGAVVLQSSDEQGVMSTHLYANANKHNLLYLPGGGTKFPPSRYSIDNKLHCIKMNGKEVFKIAVRAMSQACQEALDANGLTIDDIDLFIPHQANIRIIESTVHKLKFPMEKVVITIDKHANTSSASIPLAMDQAYKDGRLKPGDTVLMSAFGGGFTWASSIIRW